MENNILELSHIKNIHFIGIGGISMSGLAKIMLNLGYNITGSDLNTCDITKSLESSGIKIFYNHSAENIGKADLVVYSAAIKNNNPELKKARSLNIPTMERATLLGQIMKKYPYSIAVSGTHGKTTTTSMISTILLEANLDPTIHIGGVLNSIGSNTRIGGNKYFITEACEYVESFLKFFPYIGIILNIEADHLDYFKDLNHIKNSFLKFAQLIPKNGYLIACEDDPNTLSILDNVGCNKITYGLKNSKAHWSAKNISFDSNGCASYTLLKNNIEVGNITLNVPGIHNISNSLAAVASCSILGLNLNDIKNGLLKFYGTHRRFETKGEINHIKVIDDYAHHPSEISATLNTAKKLHHSKLWCIFQPHTYTRTKSLLNDFASCFNDADNIIVTDIYAARETDTGEINSDVLVQKINQFGKKATYLPDFETIVSYLDKYAEKGDLIITMGAGDIDKVGEMFLKCKTDKH